MDDLLYREVILEHWKNPQNYGIISNADIDIEDHNPLCGDTIHLTATTQGETLSDIKFTGEGCAISKASASILTELVKGMPIKEFKAISQEAYLQNLEVQLTPARLKCALLPYSTLQKGCVEVTT